MCEKISIFIDGTCDAEARYMANIIGTFESDGPVELFLLVGGVLESVNHCTICKFFNESVFLLWPKDV